MGWFTISINVVFGLIAGQIFIMVILDIGALWVKNWSSNKGSVFIFAWNATVRVGGERYDEKI